jgi:hypothetical protein
MTTSAPDKLIVTNAARLVQKYKAAGAARVHKAVQRLITADGTRGIVSKLVDLSDPAMMATYGSVAVSAANASDARLNKKAIDAVFRYGPVRPAYLMLLGSTDVIPHVPLANPMAGDGDSDVPSDLPYACDHPYSTDAQDFIAPARVVGRLPNVTNDTDPRYLIGLLDTAATYAQRPGSDYNDFLGISAQVWQASTELSLDAVFGKHTGMRLAPPDGYKLSAALLKRPAHFVNCHGAAADPQFYGQKGAAFPVAHSAAWVAGKPLDGIVMAAECCYGAELYDPALALGQMGMCNTYLDGKAYAYFGSTNIAYGPTTTNDQADLLCQHFLLGVQAGASAGRACLESRLKYVVAKGGVLMPVDLKTLAQFTLMADPSLTPVAAAPLAVVPAVRKAHAVGATVDAVARHERLRRRAALSSRAAIATAYRLLEPTSPPGGGKTGAFGRLRTLAAEFGISAPDVVLSYSLGPIQNLDGAKGLRAHAAVAGPGPTAVHTLLERLAPPAGLPHLQRVRGVQAIEYEDGMEARAFESR